MSQDIKVCTGCGVPLQTEKPEMAGYTPASALQREHPVCQRCFRIKHYSEVAPIAISDEDFVRIISQIRDKKALVIKVVDLFDFSGSWIKDLRKYIGNNPVLLVANKVDLLPKQTNLEKVERWLRREAEKKGVQLENVALISAHKGLNVEQVKTFIEKYANERDVYVVGTANVGKSTLINRLIKMLGDEKNVELTTSRFPGTTLSSVQVEIPNYTHKIIDTPGIMTTHRLTDLVCPDCLKLMIPDKTIDPRSYQLNSEQTLFLGGLARFDFVSGERQSFVCYVANQLLIHRTKLENADAIYEKHVGEMLVPPCGNCGNHLQDMVSHRFTFQENSNLDLVISGLGWITVRSACEILLHVPRGVDVTTRLSVI